ncbi:hypothetical protein M6I34_11655 [Burkholderiaceae bacterium FT117]|uniref:DUF6776 family protein n=1 Tax=Zeimonas sediminis TaxID=2944268 RepID=UPI002342C085|nr:DUF6776 family protein [Zeimonas sediminis]MCM5571161.1 hypothetical protein [Zeimonas sediminis]
MALFGRNKPVVFDPYGSSRRSGFPIPRWLIILMLGIVLGAGGLFYAEENYLPPRLTPAESQRLQNRLAELESERQRLQGELDRTTAEAKSAATAAARQIESTRTENEKLKTELAAARESVAPLKADIEMFAEVLPPDPRGGAIAIRAANFSNVAGQLDYHVLLTRDQKEGKPFEGVMELIVAGSRGGRNDTVALDPVPASFASYRHMRGKLPLPEGFEGRQVTVRVLDRVGGRQLGMRVLYVR